MNIDWKKQIEDQFSDRIVEALREIRQQRPDLGVSLNYRIHWPRGFEPGQRVFIPITTPYNGGEELGEGRMELGHIDLEVNSQMEVVRGGLKWNKPIRRFDPNSLNYQADNGSMSRSLSANFGRISSFLDDLNEILTGEAATFFTQPRTRSAQPKAVPGGSTQSRFQFDMGNRDRITVGARRREPASWTTVREQSITAEKERARTIKTREDREDFLHEVLKSPAKAPTWYRMLGGRVQRQMKQKIIEAYLNACDRAKATLPPTAFLQKLTEKMHTQEDILPWCERNSQTIMGTATECEQTDCPIYRPDCRHYSHRVNSYNLQT